VRSLETPSNKTFFTFQIQTSNPPHQLPTNSQLHTQLQQGGTQLQHKELHSTPLHTSSVPNKTPPKTLTEYSPHPSSAETSGELGVKLLLVKHARMSQKNRFLNPIFEWKEDLFLLIFFFAYRYRYEDLISFFLGSFLRAFLWDSARMQNSVLYEEKFICSSRADAEWIFVVV
jgi:hypothetical protein